MKSYSRNLGFFLLTLLVLVALFGPFFSSYSYDDQNLALKNQPPGSLFWLGSDDLGRDIFTRCCYGLRISLFIGIIAALIDLVIGVGIGFAIAFSKKRNEELLMRLIDCLYSLPYILVVMVVLLVLGPGLLSIIAALSLTGWITITRIVRFEFSLLKHEEYVVYSKMLGATKKYILMKHLIPNCKKAILGAVGLTIPSAIFAESFLSFLGLGVQAPLASLGTMASDSLAAIEYYPWRLLVPLAFIALLILGFNLAFTNFNSRKPHLVSAA